MHLSPSCRGTQRVLGYSILLFDASEQLGVLMRNAFVMLQTVLHSKLSKTLVYH